MSENCSAILNAPLGVSSFTWPCQQQPASSKAWTHCTHCTHTLTETLIHTLFSSGRHTPGQRTVVVWLVTIATGQQHVAGEFFQLLHTFLWIKKGPGPSNTLWSGPEVFAVNSKTTKPKQSVCTLANIWLGNSEQQHVCGEHTHPERKTEKVPDVHVSFISAHVFPPWTWLKRMEILLKF